MIYELEEYLRGRKFEKISALMSKVMLEHGIDKQQIVLAPYPVATA